MGLKRRLDHASHAGDRDPRLPRARAAPRRLAFWSAVVGAAIAGPARSSAARCLRASGGVCGVSGQRADHCRRACSPWCGRRRTQDDPTPDRLDPIGLALWAIGLTAVVYGVIRGGDLDSWTRPEVYGPAIGGLVLLAAFVLWERRVGHPALDVSCFAKRPFSAAVVA